ncbi:MAG: methionine--tRNA ligase, partial [Geminicoccaceae bacterium]
TITPPTPNGDLHIGHLSGPFLAADVFSKAQRLLGREVFLYSYCDDYQSYVLRRALEEGGEPTVLAATNAQRIEATLSDVGISLDHWLIARDNAFFKDAVSTFYDAAVKHGSIAPKLGNVPYCPTCKLWGYEAFARGRCNHCGAASDPSQCESCAHAPAIDLMTDLTCVRCGQAMVIRQVEQEFLKLGDYRDCLRDLYAAMPARPALQAFAEEVLALDDLDWPISRPYEAGLDLLPDGSRRIHTWFMGIAGYRAALAEHMARKGAPATADHWWSDSETMLVHFLGLDCAFSHGIVYPALLANFDPTRPKLRLFTNHFLKLQGVDFSTSRDHAIWIRDLVAETCSDSVRLFVASVSPEQQSANFDCAVFRRWHESVFIGLLPHLLDQATAEHDNDNPADFTNADHDLLTEMRRRWLEAVDLDRFSMRALALLQFDLISVLRNARADDRPLAAWMVLFATFGRPLHPELSGRIFTALGCDGEVIVAWLADSTREVPEALWQPSRSAA